MIINNADCGKNRSPDYDGISAECEEEMGCVGRGICNHNDKLQGVLRGHNRL